MQPAAGLGGADVGTDCASARSDNWCPQERQNGFPVVTGSPHDGHRPKGAPQSSQNRSPSPRDAPHRGHVTTRHLYPHGQPRYMARNGGPPLPGSDPMPDQDPSGPALQLGVDREPWRARPTARLPEKAQNRLIAAWMCPMPSHPYALLFGRHG